VNTTIKTRKFYNRRGITILSLVHTGTEWEVRTDDPTGPNMISFDTYEAASEYYDTATATLRRYCGYSLEDDEREDDSEFEVFDLDDEDDEFEVFDLDDEPTPSTL